MQVVQRHVSTSLRDLPACTVPGREHPDAHHETNRFQGSEPSVEHGRRDGGISREEHTLECLGGRGDVVVPELGAFLGQESQDRDVQRVRFVLHIRPSPQSPPGVCTRRRQPRAPRRSGSSSIRKSTPPAPFPSSRSPWEGGWCHRAGRGSAPRALTSFRDPPPASSSCSFLPSWVTPPRRACSAPPRAGGGRTPAGSSPIPCTRRDRKSGV